MLWASLSGFLVAVLPAVLTPGVSLTLAVAETARGRRHAALWVAAGTGIGIYCHALLASAGLAALVLRSSELFTAVKFVGAGYLVVLGVLSVRRARRGDRPSRRGSPARPTRLPWTGHHPFLQSWLGNVLNPKAALIYLTIAPSFLPAHLSTVTAMLTLATVHVAAMSCWIVSWAAAVRRAHRAATERFRRAVDYVGGAVLMALGVKSGITAAGR